MTKQKIFLFSIIIFLAIGHLGLAVAQVPKTAPLQPKPGLGNKLPVIKEEINTKGSPFYVEPQPNQTGTTASPGPSSPEVNPDNFSSLAPTGVEAPPTSGYWYLLFAGLAGLIGIGVWSYFRFVRKT